MCDDAHHGCVLTPQLTACDGKAEGEACSYPGVADGACYDGVCLPRGCGNGVLDAGEVCDDGNNLYGDGCSADCRSVETCGNGVIDIAKGESCDDGNTVDGDGCQASCVTPACGDGVVDSANNEACDDGASNSNTVPDACRKNCQRSFCGDGVVDSGEVCDDANTSAGDGCSYQCQSDETCGNGFLDVAAGEQCDDGNALSHDGCSSCGYDRSTWAQGPPRGQPPGGWVVAYDAARGKLVMVGNTFTSSTVHTWEWSGSAWLDVTPSSNNPPSGTPTIAYDAARRRVVLFGGWHYGAQANGADTWTWDGSAWTKLAPPTSPPPRDGHAMSYDAARGKIVLFGGSGDSGELADTWEWDGTTWTNVTPVGTSPPARDAHALAYDAARGRLVLFGGKAGSVSLNDTWEWSGTAWSNLSPGSGSPPARNSHAMAYDPPTGKVLLFGGQDASALADTWAWNGTTWTDVTPPANGPIADPFPAMAYDGAHDHIVLIADYAFEAGTWAWNGTTWLDVSPMENTPRDGTYAAMAYDVARARLVLFGGGNSPYTPSAFTWEWDGATWFNMSPAGVSNSPPGRSRFAMAYDVARGKVVLFGGAGSGGALLSDTWEWDGTAWTEKTPAIHPSARQQHALAYDAARGKVVLFGGALGNYTQVADTWEWDGTSWTDVTPAAGNPLARQGHAMAFDGARNRVVLFGGFEQGAGPMGNDTWEWNGSKWTEVTPATGNPAGRQYGTLAYDAGRGKLVLHGGFDGTSSNGYLKDTWEWNGSAWTDVTPLGDTMPPRSSHVMAYDAARARVVVFGGFSGNFFLSDTREWDGTGWTDVSPSPGNPPARRGHAMAYDLARGKVVMFGGTGLRGELSDTWQWDGGGWLRSPIALGAPSARDHHAMAFDAAHGTIVLFGGTTGGAPSADTWVFDGSTWTDVTPAGTNPPARSAQAMVYDAARGKVLMFGGKGSSLPLGDTWEWNGSSWTERIVSVHPSAREGLAMAYDAARGRTVLYGGTDVSQSTLGDTWEWNGTAWTDVTPVGATLPGRKEHAMAYDAARGRVVLFGGVATDVFGTELADTWEWNGSTWNDVTAVTQNPSARNGHAMAYDVARAQIVLYGGVDSGSSSDSHYVADTWTFRYERPGAVEGCGTGIDGDGDGLIGCADPDCFGYCTPSCNPTLMVCDPAWPHCGDGTCQPIETKRLCPADCGAPTPRCGDFLCESPETMQSCPGDCQ